MRNRKLLTIARRWWPSHGGDYDHGRVDTIVRRRQDLVPALIRALVRTAPQGGASYVGVCIIEDLDFIVERGERPNRTLELLLQARLTQGELFEVLSGPWVSHLESIGVDDRLLGTLSREQLAWLLDEAAPNRRSDAGVMVADGHTIRFVEGQSEWSRLYWSPQPG